MLEYNTQKEKLVLPEYGRNVQQMVDHCMSIEDREERTRCAYAIIDIMSNLFSNLRHVDDFNKMLWNQLAILAVLLLGCVVMLFGASWIIVFLESVTDRLSDFVHG